MENKISFPICGCFTSKRGTTWNYKIYKDLTVEQWHTTYKKCAGGYRSGKDIYSPKVTKECAEYIKNKHGLEVKNQEDKNVSNRKNKQCKGKKRIYRSK